MLKTYLATIICLLVKTAYNQGVLDYQLTKVDTTEILLLHKYDNQKINLVFLEGSLPKISFIKHDSIYYVGNQNIIRLSEHYNLFFFSKPGIPLIVEEGNYDQKGFYLNDSDSLNSYYYNNDNMHYYIQQYSKCLKVIQKRYGRKKIILFGHSQGARIASELALSNKKIVSQLIFASADPLGRISTAIDHDYTDTTKVDKIKYYLETYTQKKESDTNTENQFDIKSWQSFSYPSLITLSALKIPVYIYYGNTDYTNCPNCYIYEFLPIYFKNITTIAIDGDHNFFVDKTKSNWNLVINDIIIKNKSSKKHYN